MSDKKSEETQEVDLGQLFRIIGKMFSNLFNFIASIFKGAFKLLILILIQLYRGRIWFIGAIIIGFILGFIVDKDADDVYGAHLYIETNFGSTRQVYENIRNLDILARRDNDSTELGRILGIESIYVSNLRGFTIEPDFDENNLVEQFSEYKEELDSLSRLDVNYKDYKEKLAYYNFPIHKIGIVLSSKHIHDSLRVKLTKYLTNNKYLENIRNRTQINLEMESNTLEKQTTELDSLTKEYFKIRVSESQKKAQAGSGTNVYMAGSEDQSNLLIDETALLDKRYALEKRKREIELEKLEKEEIISILSDFPKSGYNISNWTNEKKIIYPVMLFGLTFLGSLTILLLKYLKKQDELYKNA